MHQIFIDGAAGTTGLEIRQRLEGRKDFALITLVEADRKNDAKRREAMAGADFTILCLPDEAARDAVALLGKESDTRFIDASSAHRTNSAWTYGFPELAPEQRAAIADTRLLSNPGCYPTGFLALVAPLIAAGLLPSDWPYSVNAVSGYSGGGKALIERFQTADAPAFRTYGLALDHKHVAEMRVHAGLAENPIFAPSVVPGFRGMIVEVPLPISAMPGTPPPRRIIEKLAEHYDGEALVKVHLSSPPDELLIERRAAPSDRLDIHALASEDGRQMRLVAVLDNLGKGASGAAVQNLNLMAGLPEADGLLI